MFETALKERDKKMIEQGASKKAIETAKKMLGHGLSVQLIAECTGLTVDEIEKFGEE